MTELYIAIWYNDKRCGLDAHRPTSLYQMQKPTKKGQ